MELVLSFVCGLALASIIAYFIFRGMLKMRDEQAEIRVKAQIEAHEKAMNELEKRLDETMNKVSEQVKTQTNEMLIRRQKEFSESSNNSINQIVTPLKDNIAELKKVMEAGNKELAERNGEMKERITSLMEHSEAARKSADELAAAFRHGNKIQGDWGETILEELLNSQNLKKGIHYHSQDYLKDELGKIVTNEEGSKLRPDIILHLDDKRDIIIDSKVSLAAYIDYVNAENEVDRINALKRHIDSLKAHVKELSSKDYSKYIQKPKISAGYVIMFVPNSVALWTAMNKETSLWRDAAEKNVYIADEQSLYAALKIVKLTWSQITQAQNHEQVYNLANEMIDRVGQFLKRYNDMGSALKKVNEEYEKGLKKLSPEGQSIINTSQKLLKLGAKNSDKNRIPEEL